MYFTTKISIVLPLLVLQAFAAPAPETALSKRGGGAGCVNSAKLYNNADANTLSHNLQSLNPNTMHYLPHNGGCAEWTIGSAKVCVHNYYLSDNTHASEWEVGWGVAYVQEHCCNSIDGRW